MITDGTMEAIAKIVGWSFNVLLTGLRPELDENGAQLNSAEAKYLANGWKAALVHVRGDWEFFNSIFWVPHWANEARMCWLCGALGSNKSPLRYSRSDCGAPWRETRLTHEQYLRLVRAAGELLCPWFAYTVGLRIECLLVDVLHAVDLGVMAHLVGNILYEIISLREYGSTIAESCANLQKLMKKFYKDNGLKYEYRGKLTGERIKTSNGWPKMKGQAASVRSLGPFALYLAEKHLGPRQVFMKKLLLNLFLA